MICRHVEYPTRCTGRIRDEAFVAIGTLLPVAGRQAALYSCCCWSDQGHGYCKLLFLRCAHIDSIDFLGLLIHLILQYGYTGWAEPEPDYGVPCKVHTTQLTVLWMSTRLSSQHEHKIYWHYCTLIAKTYEELRIANAIGCQVMCPSWVRLHQRSPS